MQTFLPYDNFARSAAVLDRQRLGKQRVECLQLLKALTTGGGWANHPATRMWRGYTDALVAYGTAVCDEWTERGYRDTCRDKILAYEVGGSAGNYLLPAWWGDPDVHASHRSNLLRKDPVWYGLYDWSEPDTLPYVWPV
jgi:hypothetical protein